MQSLLMRLLLAICLLLAGCSMEATINAMSSAEDRQFAQDVIRHIREGDEDWLRERVGRDDWERRRGAFESVRELYPEGSEPRLVGFQSESSFATGVGSRARKQFTLVNQARDRWVVTLIEIQSTGGPFRISEFQVRLHDERPPELVLFDASERMVPFLWAFAIGFLLVVIGIIFAFIRYRRKKQEQLSR